MNIGVDATCWNNNRGFGRFTRELLTALFLLDSDHTFYVFVDQPQNLSIKSENVEMVHLDLKRPTTKAAVAAGRRSLMDIWRLYRAAAARPLDIMFYPAVYSWFPVPLGIPSMVTIHDAIAEHFPDLVFPGRKGRLFWALKVRLALWSCRRILTVSCAAKREIVEYMNADPAMIDLTSEAPVSIFRRVTDERVKMAARQRAGLPPEANLIVYVGGLAPHKNLDGLLDGFALASPEIDNVHLALVGDFRGAGFHSNYRNLRNRVSAEPALQGRVHFTDHVSDEDLAALYSSALALALPSFSEGFGLPAIEAMSCGVPVLASNRGSLPEVVGEAGIYFDPYKVAEIAEALIQISSDDVLRQRLSAIAETRAGQYTWRGAAQKTLGFLEHMQGA